MQHLDQQQVKRASDRAATGYANADFFCHESRSRLLERLEFISLEPADILDLGGGNGAGSAMLRQRYPKARVINLDWSTAMLASDKGIRVCADARRLPFRDNSFDLIVSNMMLASCDEPGAVFAEACRVLRVPGLFLFNTLGPDTLIELRRVWSEVDRFAHVHEFADMHNVGDALVQSGFREPVMDVEKLRITYTDIDRLFGDLRGIGATNLHPERRRGLMAPGTLNAIRAAADQRRDEDGKFAVSAEIVTGQAWTAETTGVAMEDGIAHFPLNQLRRRD